MVDTMRAGVYSRAWYILAFFGAFLGLAIAWLVLHRRDGFNPRGLVMWTVAGQFVIVGFVVVVYTWALVASVAAPPFGYLP